MTEIEKKRANAQEALKTLKRGKERLLTKGWCQHTYARMIHGFVVSPEDPRALSFCALGACMASRPYEMSKAPPYKEYLEKALRLRGSGHFWVPSFNDHLSTTKEDVLSLFDEAIALAEKEAE